MIVPIELQNKQVQNTHNMLLSFGSTDILVQNNKGNHWMHFYRFEWSADQKGVFHLFHRMRVIYLWRLFSNP